MSFKHAIVFLFHVEFRHIKVNYRRNLIEVKSNKKEAVFENLDTGEKETFTVRQQSENRFYAILIAFGMKKILVNVI